MKSDFFVIDRFKYNFAYGLILFEAIDKVNCETNWTQ